MVRHIIPLYTYVMIKRSNTVSIHSSTNKSMEDDEFQIKIDSKINLPLLQIANGVIQNHIDFLNFVTKNKGHSEKFTTYEKLKFRKYKTIVNSLFKELKVNDLMKVMLLIDEIEASEISFFKHVQSVDNHVTILIQLYHVGVGIIVHAKNVLTSIGYTNQLIVVKLRIMLIIVLPVLLH